MNWIFRTLLILVMLHPASVVLAQASITLTGPSSTSYMAPANFDLRADYYVSSGPKAEFIEEPVITQNGSPIARLLEGAVPVRGLPAGRYEYMFTGRAVRILPDGDMTSRPLRSGPIVIDVTSPPEPVDAGAPGATSYPNPSLAGRPGSVSIQMINTGETTWRAGTYVLDTPHDFTRDFWQFTAQPVTHDVAPGASFTFNFSITPRYYDQHVEWRNIEFQLRRDQFWFGLKSYTSIFVREPMNAATFESQSVPLQMEAGKQYAINVRMRNTGDDPWSSEAGYSLGSQNPADNTIWGTHRIQTGSVAPGAVGDFSATVTAPAAAGTYNFQWRMVRDGVEWFGVQTPNVVVSVIAPPPPPPPTIVGKTFVYDALGRSIGTSSDSELGPLVTATTYMSGNRTAHLNARSKVTLTTYQSYDVPHNEHQVLIEEPEGRITQIDRDRYGSIRRISRNSGHGSIERRYVYDSNKRLCKTIEPESGTTITGYDAAGRISWYASGLPYSFDDRCVESPTQYASRIVNHSYDINGRLSNVSSGDGYGDQHISYTKDGLVMEVSASNGDPTLAATTRTRYDTRRHFIQETSIVSGRSDWTVRHYYDSSGSLIRQEHPQGITLNYDNDALGRPTNIYDGTGLALASKITYGADGSVQTFTYGNGVAHRSTQNERLLLREIVDGNHSSLVYSYDANGNPAQIFDKTDEGSDVQELHYDGADRLIRVNSASRGQSESFSYDVNDNITEAVTDSVRSWRYYYDSSNRLTNIDDGTGSIIGLAYDSGGNLISRNGKRFTFDSQNRLRVFDSTTTYSYDAAGRRVLRIEPGAVEASRYMYLASGTLARYFDAEKQQTVTNITIGGKIIGSIHQSRDGTSRVLYHHTNSIGSVIAQSNESGELIAERDYSAYGRSTDATHTMPGYAGHMEDSSSALIYMQQRYFDPEIGIFLSVDPLRNFGENFHRYRYGNSNPYKFVDPDGLEACLPGGHCGISNPFSGSVFARNSLGSDNRTRESFSSPEASDGPRISPAGSMGELILNVLEASSRRVSFSASGGAAGGIGFDAIATKATKTWQKDKVGIFQVFGLGSYSGANANIRLFSWGNHAGTTGLRLKGSPMGYFKVRLGAGVSLGLSGQMNDHGAGRMNITIGGGIGAQAIVKPPLSPGWEKEL